MPQVRTLDIKLLCGLLLAVGLACHCIAQVEPELDFDPNEIPPVLVELRITREQAMRHAGTDKIFTEIKAGGDIEREVQQLQTRLQSEQKVNGGKWIDAEVLLELDDDVRWETLVAIREIGLRAKFKRVNIRPFDRSKWPLPEGSEPKSEPSTRAAITQIAIEVETDAKSGNVILIVKEMAAPQKPELRSDVGDMIKRADVSGKLSIALKKNPKAALIVTADPSVSFGIMKKVLEDAPKVGVKKIQYAVRVPERAIPKQP